MIWDQFCSSGKDLGTYNSIRVLYVLLLTLRGFSVVLRLTLSSDYPFAFIIRAVDVNVFSPSDVKLIALLFSCLHDFFLTQSCRIKRCIIPYLHLMGSALYSSLCMVRFDRSFPRKQYPLVWNTADFHSTLTPIWAPQLNIQSHGYVVFPLTFCPHFTCGRKESHPVYLSMSPTSTIMINHVQNRQHCIYIQFLSAVQGHRWGSKSFIFYYTSPFFFLSLSSTLNPLNNPYRYTYWQASDSAWHASPLSFCPL